MLVISIILSVILLIALLRVGAIIEYNADGVAVWLKIAFLKIHINTDGGKKKKRKPRSSLDSLKPGSLSDFMDMLKAIKETLNRLRRKLLIKKLLLHITFAGDDPSKVAIQYGSANAVFAVIVPVLEKHFRIKRRDLRAAADFESKETQIYAKLNISIAVWEAIYVALALLPMFNTQSAAQGSKKRVAAVAEPQSEKILNQNDEMKGHKDGKRTDKQYARNDDAENKGDDRS